MRKLEKEESMMCRNDKSRVGPKWKTQQYGRQENQYLLDIDNCKNPVKKRVLLCIFCKPDGSYVK